MSGSEAVLHLEKFFELAIDPMCVANTEGRFLRVNNRFCGLLGHTEEEMTGVPFLEFVHPDDRDRTRVEMEKLRRGQRVSRFRNRYRCHDRSWRHLLWEVTPPDEGGLVYAVVRDVTEEWRKRETSRLTQRRLLRHQETLLHLRDNEHDSIDEFLRVVTERCAEAIDIERAGVWLFSTDEESIECRDLYCRASDAHERGVVLRRSEAPRYFHAVASYDALAVRNACSDAATHELAECYLRPNGIASVLDVPIRSGGRLAGVLCFEHAGAARQWDPLEEKFATSVAAYLMTAIERAERWAREVEIRDLNASLERRVAERTAELSASERRFRLLVESIQDYAVCVLDPRGVVATWNAGARRAKGYAPEEIIGRHSSCFYTAEDCENGRPERLLETARTAGYVADEGWRVRKDGTRFWAMVVITAIRDEAGGLREFAKITHDLTAQRRVERELRASEEQFRAAMEHSAIGMALVGTDGRWLRVNRSLCEIVGYSEEELLSLDFQSITHPDDLDTDLDQLRAVLAGEFATYQMEKRYFHKGGDIVWVMLSVSLVRTDAGAPKYFISQMQDVTERKKADEALRTALEHQKELVRLAQAGERARSEFLAMMSHEVRTPMNGILGFGELLAQTPGLPAEAREYAETIVQSGGALLRILDDILDWSRLDAGALEIELAPFSPAELLRDIHTLLTPIARGKGLDLRLEVDPLAGGRFLGDAGRIRQVILNLAGNAIKFTDRGMVTMSGRANGHGVEFFVRDTGRGIDPAQLERVFDPFVQADSSQSRRHGGAGLGLSISRSLASLMGGEISASSRPGEGSEFAVRLRLQRATADGDLAMALPSRPALDAAFARRVPLSLLVVEDDNVNLRLIITMLRKLGYEPLFAKDGLEALEIYGRERPECVLMDVQMPAMDGIAATREIRAMEAHNQWPPAYICALTADTLVSDRTCCLAAGMSEYLNKPLQRDQLMRVLEAAGARNAAEAGRRLSGA